LPGPGIMAGVNTVVIDEPEYPVINAHPTFFAVLRNWQMWDYTRLVGGTAIGAGWGFAVGVCRSAGALSAHTQLSLSCSPCLQSRASRDVMHAHSRHALSLATRLRRPFYLLGSEECCTPPT
jgi:hypothetical protein